MGRHNGSRQGGYGRNRLKPKSGGETYFVPSFSLRRQAEQGERLDKFLSDIESKIGRAYKVYQPGDVSMTVIEQSKMINQLRDAKEKPQPQKVENIARVIASGLFSLIKNTDPGIDLPIGILSRFGGDGRKNKIGFIPRGWKGYQAKYARVNEAGEKMPVGLIVDESIFAVGSIATGFSHNKRFVINGLARTPHVSFIQKVKGDISESEFREVSGGIMEVIDDMEFAELRFNDPIIYPKYYPGEKADPITVRQSLD